jgi:hypothetical protein
VNSNSCHSLSFPTPRPATQYYTTRLDGYRDLCRSLIDVLAGSHSFPVPLECYPFVQSDTSESSTESYASPPLSAEPSCLCCVGSGSRCTGSRNTPPFASESTPNPWGMSCSNAISVACQTSGTYNSTSQFKRSSSYNTHNLPLRLILLLRLPLHYCYICRYHHPCAGASHIRAHRARRACVREG